MFFKDLKLIDKIQIFLKLLKADFITLVYCTILLLMAFATGKLFQFSNILGIFGLITTFSKVPILKNKIAKSYYIWKKFLLETDFKALS